MKNISKYRNIFGEDHKEYFSDIHAPEGNTEGFYMDLNSNFLAISWVGKGGYVMIHDPSVPDRTPADKPHIKAHDGNVTNLKFSPYRNSLLCTCSEDCKVKLWEIPEKGLTENMTEELQHYNGHTKKVVACEFNPVCQDVIATGSYDSTVHTWNIIKAEPVSIVEVGQPVCQLVWNHNGSQLGATIKGKGFVIDPRKKEITHTINCFENTRITRMHFIDDDHVVAIGTNKVNKKQIKLFDLRKVTDGQLSEDVSKIDLDSRVTYFWSFYDYGRKLLYYAGKGENSYHVYDMVQDDKVMFCNSIHTAYSPISITAYPEKLMDYNRIEIMKFATLTNNHVINFSSIYVPRKVKQYERALYPDVFVGESAIDYDGWVSGQNAEPIVKEINTVENKWVSEPIKFEKKVEEVKLTPEEELKVVKKELQETKEELARVKASLEQCEQENKQLKAKLEEAGVSA